MRPRHLMLLLLALLTLALLSAPFTSIGTRTLIGFANRIDTIDIRYLSGSLAGQMELEHVRVQTDSVKLEALGISADLAPACYWRSTICLEQLDVEQVSVEWPGGHWRQAQMSARVELSESTIRVESAKILGAELLLEAAADDEPADDKELSLPEIDLPLDLEVRDLVIEDARANIRGAVQQIQHLQLSARWQRQQLAIEELRIVTPEGEGGLSGSLEFQQQWPLDLVAVVEALQMGDKAYRLQARLSGDLSAAGLQVEAAGVPQLELDAQVNLVAPGMPFTGVLALTLPAGEALGEAFSLPLSLSQVQLAGPWQAQFQGDLESQQIQLNGALSGLGYTHLAVQLKAEQSHGELLVETLELRDAATDSTLLATGKINLENTLVVDGSLRSAGFELPQTGSSFSGRLAGEGQFSASVTDEEWYLDLQGVDISGDINNLPAMLSGYARLEDGLRIGETQLRGQVNGAQLSVDASRDENSGALIELQLADLARWHEDARGRFRITATRSPDGQAYDVSGDIQQLAWGGLTADAGELQGRASADGESFSLDAQLRNLGSGEMELESLRLLAAGSLQQHSIRLDSSGEITGSLDVAGRYESGSWSGELAPAEFSTGSGVWSSSDTVALSWEAETGTLELAEHCWLHSDFSACTGSLQLGSNGQVNITASGDLGAFNALVPADLLLAGSVELQIDSDWSPATPLRLQAQGESKNVTVTRSFGLGDSVTVSWDSLSTSLTHDSAGLQLSSELYRQGQRVIALDLKLPPTSQQELSGTLRFNDMELRSAAPWAPELSRLDGQLNGELRLAGSVDQPRALGELRLSQGYMALEGNPTELTELDLQLELAGDSANLTGSGLLGGGELQLKGVLNSQPQWQLELEITGTDHQVQVPPAAELTISEQLVLKVIPGLVDISGDIQVLKGVLHHEQLPAGSVAVSPDVVEVDIAGNLIRQESDWKVRSDVWLRLGERLQLRGDSINATLGGNLHVLQKPGQPVQVFGNLKILGGELRAYQQRLVIQRGTVAFSGPPDNPALDIRAEREIRDEGVKVGASLQGRLEEPTLEVYSDPAMAEGEAMSYLVRGRGLDSGAGADGTALALAMGADVVNRSGMVSSINRIPGISDVAFGSSGSEDDTTATVSGYLGERIYLSYGIGLYEPVNELTARFYLQTRLWLEVVSRLENSVDIYYSFDLD